MLSLIDTKELRPAQAALALNMVSEMDFLRLQAIARLYARGLPADVGWDDLLQEAFTRVLVGARVKPDGIAMLPFIAGIIRSLRSDRLRRAFSTEPGRDRELLDPAPGLDLKGSAAFAGLRYPAKVSLKARLRKPEE